MERSGGRQCDGHRFQAGDFEFQRSAFRLLRVPANGAERLMEEGFAGAVRHLPLQRLQTGPLGPEHLGGRLEPRLFASQVRFGHGPRAGEEVVPWGTDRSEPGEERHEGDADDADALETRFREAVGMARRRRVCGPRPQQTLSAPPEAQQPSGESRQLQNPGETKAPLARAGEFISGGSDDGVDFQEWDGENEEEEQERDGQAKREPSCRGVHGVGDFA